MADFSDLHRRARHDLRMCYQAWSETLREHFGKRIKCAYAKGSAIKPWDSPIDYVPVLSDADIHICLNDERDFFEGCDDPFAEAMKMSSAFERRFYEMEPNPLHFPRSQIVHINKFMQSEKWTPPRQKEVQQLIGDFNQEPLPSDDKIREWDLENLLELREWLGTVPMSAVDRAGFDFWSLIRRMVFRVSPSPVRLLTQDYDDPYDVWSWNRTKIADELGFSGHLDIQRHYRGFYDAGWRLFLSNFSDNSSFREVTNHGYYVLKGCYEKAASFSVK